MTNPTPNAPRETPPICRNCRWAEFYGQNNGTCRYPMSSIFAVIPVNISRSRLHQMQLVIYKSDTEHCPTFQPREEPADAK